MRNCIIKIISLLISLTLAFTVVACSPSGDPNKDNGQNNNEFVDTYVDTVNLEQISDSSNYFISGGISDYKILVSNNEYSSAIEIKAASELNYFIKDAYGFTLPVVYDTDESVGAFDVNKKYVSLGYTSFYYASDMGEMDFSVLGNDGYKIQTYGNVVIINACGNNGIIYGAYGFLERNLNYRYYAQDEWTITNSPNVLLKNMNVVAVPDFDSRYLDGNSTTHVNQDWVVRLRQHGRSGSQYGGMEGGGWIGSDQSICREFLDYTVYAETHPEWYYNGGSLKDGQLCFTTVLTNDAHSSDGIRPLDELIKNVIKKYIIPNETARVIMFGINDNEKNYCNCSACTTEVFKIKHSGQMCLFMNAVRKAINDWQAGATTFPGGTPIPSDLIVTDSTSFNATRDIKLAFFAYLYCIDAPVNTNGTVISYDAKYKCLGGTGTSGDGKSTDVTLLDDIVVRIAHLRAENMHAQFDTTYNSVSYNAYEQWSKLCSNLATWDYATSFSDYIAPYPEWSVIADNFKYYRTKGVSEILTQLPSSTSGTSFLAMMTYVRSQLMWDADQDVEWLYRDFIYNYYGPQAFDAIYGYFTFLRNYYHMADAKNSDGTYGFINADGERFYYHGDIYEYLSITKAFPYATTVRLQRYFNDAEESLALVKNTEPKYQKYLDRVQIESLFVRYMLIKNFSDKYNSKQLEDMLNEFERIAKLGNLTEVNDENHQRIKVKEFIDAKRASL